MKDGVFYAVQIVPDLTPFRIKFGFATALAPRLYAYGTALPTASLLGAWACDRDAEPNAIEALTVGARHVGGEAYDVPCHLEVLRLGADHFGAAASGADDVPLSGSEAITLALRTTPLAFQQIAAAMDPKRSAWAEATLHRWERGTSCPKGAQVASALAALDALGDGERVRALTRADWCPHRNARGPMGDKASRSRASRRPRSP